MNGVLSTLQEIASIGADMTRTSGLRNIRRM